MIQTSGNEEEWEVITLPESEAEQLEQSPPDSDDRLNETLELLTYTYEQD